MDTNYSTEQTEGGVPVKMSTCGVPVEPEAKQLPAKAAHLPDETELAPKCKDPKTVVPSFVIADPCQMSHPF